MHGFYAIMGGFAVDTYTPGEEPYVSDFVTSHKPVEITADRGKPWQIPGSPKLAANDRLILVAAKRGLLPDISKEYIKDKSKADHLAKMLVIAQATWLILQVVMRWASKLLVTALELNTLAHSICALLVYSLWWDKPLDIQDPTLLIGSYFPPLVALSWEAAVVNLYDKKQYEVKYRKCLPRALGYKSNVEFDVRRTNIENREVLEGIRIASGPWSDALVGAFKASYDTDPVGCRFLEIRDGKAHKRVLLLNRNTKRYLRYLAPQITSLTPELVGVLELTKAGAPLEEHPRSARNDHALQRWRLISTVGTDYTETLEFINASISHFNIDTGTAFPPKVIGSNLCRKKGSLTTPGRIWISG